MISAVYPRIKLVYGDLDDLELLEEESAKADIILNWADSDHPKSTEAIVHGAEKHRADKPVFLIHTSGTGILTWKTVETKTFGDLQEKIYDDWDGIDEVTSLPDGAAHRNVDKIILAAGNNPAVKTAIVCPPSIYGVGRGPGNKRSQQLYDLSRIILTSGRGMQVGKGENKQTHIHVYDLSDLYVLLVDEAIAGGGKATWGSKGYYFSSRGEQVTPPPPKKNLYLIFCILKVWSLTLNLFRLGVRWLDRLQSALLSWASSIPTRYPSSAQKNLPNQLATVTPLLFLEAMQERRRSVHASFLGFNRPVILSLRRFRQPLHQRRPG